MFCPYCGTSLVENAQFCVKCGKQIAASQEPQIPVQPQPIQPQVQSQPVQAQRNYAREAEISAVRDAISYFSQKSNIYRQYDEACANLNRLARGAKTSLLVWGCIITSFALLFLLAYFSSGTADDSYIPLVVLFLVPGLLMIVGGILMIVGNRKNYARAKEAYSLLSKELYSHYLSCPNCPVAAEYTNPEVLRQLLFVLESGRADSVKESIQLAFSARLMAQVQKYFSAISKNTANLDATTAAPAFFIAASFFY